MTSRVIHDPHTICVHKELGIIGLRTKHSMLALFVNKEITGVTIFVPKSTRPTNEE